MVKILFFAHLRETLGAGESLPYSSEIATVDSLREYLVTRGGNWTVLQTTRNLRVAINQQMATADAAISDGDEVAFFPPVTGG